MATITLQRTIEESSVASIGSKTVTTTKVAETTTTQLRKFVSTILYGQIEHCYPLTSLKYDNEEPRSQDQQLSQRRGFVNKNAHGPGLVTPGGSHTVNTDATVPKAHTHTHQTTSESSQTTQTVIPSQFNHNNSLRYNADDSQNIRKSGVNVGVMSDFAYVQNISPRQNKLTKERVHIHEQPRLTDKQNDGSISLKPEIGTEPTRPESKVCVQSKGSGHSLSNPSKLKNTKPNKNRAKGVPKSNSAKELTISRPSHGGALKETRETQEHGPKDEKTTSEKSEDNIAFHRKPRNCSFKQAAVTRPSTKSDGIQIPEANEFDIAEMITINKKAIHVDTDDNNHNTERQQHENDESKDEGNNTKTIQNPSTENQTPVIIVRPGPYVNEIVYDNPLVRR